MKIIKANTLSSKEVDLLTRLEYEGREIYTSKEILSFCGGSQKAKYLTKKLLEKRRFKKIIKNLYIFIPMKAPGGQWQINEYLIAKALARGSNYYIGYSSVFNSYGFIDQVAQIIYIINEKFSMKKTVYGTTYVMKKVLANRFYGLEKRRIGGEEVVFPNKERALVDLFEFYGSAQAFEILKSQLGKFDLSTFVEYLAKYPVQIIRRRVGYFLNKLKIDEKLLAHIKIGKKGYSPLYGGKANSGKINTRWRIIING